MWLKDAGRASDRERNAETLQAERLGSVQN